MKALRLTTAQITHTDLKAIQSLTAQLGYPSTEAEVGARLQRIMQDHGKNAVIVAKANDGQLIGWTHVREHLSLASDSRAEVTGLVVDDAWRGRGVGTLLLAEVETWSREQGLPLIRFTSNVTRTEAHRLYVRLGYESKKTSHVFVKAVARALTIAFLTLFAATGLTAAQAEASSIPPFYVEKVDSTPKLMQSLPEAKLPWRGAPHCGPVAVSNSMIWLGKNGYERLSLPDADRPEAQGQLVQLLASPKYLNTTPEDGTRIDDLLQGVARYVGDRRYKASSLLYEGWERHSPQFDTGVEHPGIEWIKEGILGRSAVWLKIGWYKYDPTQDLYTRFAGHFVTLVGYGKDENGRTDPNILIVHDSAPRAGPEYRHHYVAVTEMTHGELTRYKPFPSIAAAGFYKLGGGLKIKDGADAGILEGAIVLRMD